MRAAEAEKVRSVHIFSGMAEANFDLLMKGAFLQRFPAHVGLINETERPDFLHVVFEGSVELFSRYQGRETTLAVIRPVATFILAAVTGDLPYLASARTLEPSRILMLPSEAVRDAFDRDAAFAHAIVAELSLSFRRVMKELKGQKLRTGIERLANWVLIHDARAGGYGRFTLPYQKRTLASRLGMTPENLSRNLPASGRARGHDRRPRGAHRQPAGLTALAKPTPSIDDRDY